MDSHTGPGGIQAVPGAEFVFADGRRHTPTYRDIARFEAKVRANAAGCWLWRASKNAWGYGTFGLARRSVLAHRFAYMTFIGSIPAARELDHLCRVRECVNPWHLEPVTSGENVRRGLVGSWNRVKKHCPKGHLYDEANTSKWAGRRACRTCSEAARQRYLQRQRDLLQAQPACGHASRDGNACTRPADHTGKHHTIRTPKPELDGTE